MAQNPLLASCPHPFRPDSHPYVSDIDRSTWLLAGIGKQEVLEGRQWGPATVVDGIAFLLRFLGMGIGEIAGFCVDYLGVALALNAGMRRMCGQGLGLACCRTDIDSYD